MFVERDNRR